MLGDREGSRVWLGEEGSDGVGNCGSDGGDGETIVLVLSWEVVMAVVVATLERDK